MILITTWIFIGVGFHVFDDSHPLNTDPRTSPARTGTTNHNRPPCTSDESPTSRSQPRFPSTHSGYSTNMSSGRRPRIQIENHMQTGLLTNWAAGISAATTSSSACGLAVLSVGTGLSTVVDMWNRWSHWPNLLQSSQAHWRYGMFH
jgi:hypothetical protein